MDGVIFIRTQIPRQDVEETWFLVTDRECIALLERTFCAANWPFIMLTSIPSQAITCRKFLWLTPDSPHIFIRLSRDEFHKPFTVAIFAISLIVLPESLTERLCSACTSLQMKHTYHLVSPSQFAGSGDRGTLTYDVRNLLHAWGGRIAVHGRALTPLISIVTVLPSYKRSRHHR